MVVGVLGCMDGPGWGVGFWVVPTRVLVFFGSAGGLGVRDGGLKVCSSWWRSSGSHHVPVSYPSGSPLFSGELSCAYLG